MNRSVLLLMALACMRIASVFSGRVLAIQPYGSKSHWQYMKAIVDVLTERHHVTVITPLPTGEQRVNYTEIDASSVFPVYKERAVLDMIRDYGSVLNMVPLWPARSHERDICDRFYAFKPVKRLMERLLKRKKRDGLADNADGATAVGAYGDTDADDDEIGQVDAILLEPFYSPCLSFLANQLTVPETYSLPSYISGSPIEHLVFGVESNPSYVPHQLYNGSRIVTFTDRLVNIGLHLYVKFVPWLTETRMKFTDPRPYDVEGLRHNPVAVFVNTHNVVEEPRPFMDNMVRVGGIHLEPAKPLPEDILEFIENSPNGVIYVSFGTVASCKDLPNHTLEILNTTFHRLPQRILWKFNDENKTLSDKIMAKSWFPQRDILLHPNVKLFISHGGISGIYEAVDAAVPILGFPLFYDQPRNIGHLVESGMALSMDLSTMQKEPLWKNINELLHNESYHKNAKRISREFNDRLVSPAKQIHYWFDYLMRQKNNKIINFNSSCRQLAWYEYHLMDILYLILPFSLISLVSIFIRNKAKQNF